MPRPFSYGMFKKNRTVACKHNSICEIGREVQKQVCAFKMAKARKRTRHVFNTPRWSSAHNVDFIQGGTLVRFSVIQKNGYTWTCQVRQPAMGNEQCDRCKLSHRDSNGRCSQSIGIPTKCTAADVLYDFHTSLPAFILLNVSVSFGRKKRFGHATIVTQRWTNSVR